MGTTQTCLAIRPIAQALVQTACSAAALLCLTGCQSGNPNAMPFGGASRVPPPVTGNYPASGNYYNNTTSSNASPQGQVMQASSSSFGPSSGGAMPSTNVSAAVTPAGFQPQGFTAPPNNIPANNFPANNFPANNIPASSPAPQGQFAPVQGSGTQAGISDYDRTSAGNAGSAPSTDASLNWR